MDAGSTIDLGAIRDAQRAAALALRKREQAAREARVACAAAKSAAAAAAQQQRGASDALVQAEQAHRQAVAACAGVKDGHVLFARVRWCELAAQDILARHQQLAHAREEVARAEAKVHALAAEAMRAEQRQQQSAANVQDLCLREQLVIEIHADMALEDEPPRQRQGATR